MLGRLQDEDISLVAAIRCLRFTCVRQDLWSTNIERLAVILDLNVSMLVVHFSQMIMMQPGTSALDISCKIQCSDGTIHINTAV